MPTASRTPSGIHALACLSTLTPVHHSLSLQSFGNLLSVHNNIPDIIAVHENIPDIAVHENKVMFDSASFTTPAVLASTLMGFSAERGVDDERKTFGTPTDSGTVAMGASACVTAPFEASGSNNEGGDDLKMG